MRKNKRWVGYGALGLLVGCQPAAPSQEAAPASPRPPIAAPVPAAADAVASPPAATGPSAAQLYAPLRSASDTLLRIGGRQLRLQLRAQLDTTQQLVAASAHDTATGYQGYFTFALRDSLNRLMSRRVLTKQAFYKAVSPGLALASGAPLPRLLGYSAPLQALVFSVTFNAPETDWVCEAVLLLDVQGHVRRVATGLNVGGPSLEVTLAADGCTLLTADGIIRAGQPTLLLQQPGAELRGAFLLSDSLAVTIYEPGRLRPPGRHESASVFSVSAAQKRQPNAFVLNTHTGKTVGRFRYDGFFEALGYTIPYGYVLATRTAYLLDDKKGLYTIAARRPAEVSYYPFGSLPVAKSPKRASEIALRLAGPDHQYRFFIDTLALTRIRYQRL